ncbi:MAG: sodium:calcium antiporter [Methanobacteriota archaeon]|nr:MAG: sodium:calcium antiporter [Euryarchaeota archaeon]
MDGSWIWSLVYFGIGVILLVKGADYFVEGARGLAERLRVSKAVIGFAIISLGTSIPEFVVNMNALFLGIPDIATGNIFGSNIANIALVLGLSALLRPGVVKLGVPLPIRIWVIALSGTVIFALLALRGVIDWFAGVVLLMVFVLVLLRLWLEQPVLPPVPIQPRKGVQDLLYVIGGLAGVVGGAELVVQGAVAIALRFGVSSFVIGVSLVAIGTSLPELATSLVAVIRGEAGISVGTVLGANLYTLLFQMGIGSFVRPIPIPSIGSVLVVLAFTLAAAPLFLWSARETRTWAFLLIACYAGYMWYLFGVMPPG